MKAQELAKYFDHTLLKSSATCADVEKICDEAIQYGFFGVCVNPVHVQMVKAKLSGSGVKTCSVVGFPLGANSTAVKAEEARLAVAEGADEVDMVINLGALVEGSFTFVERDIRAVVEAAGEAWVKVILETCLLDDNQIVTACELCKSAGAHFVKTSTGFSGGGATVEHVSLIKKIVGDELLIKASGGIKNLAEVRAMLEAGADRIGASAGVVIMQELQNPR